MPTIANQIHSAFPTEDGLMMRCPGILLCYSPSHADYKNAMELWFHPPAFMNEQGWISTSRPATTPQWEPIQVANERRNRLYNLIGELPRPAFLLRPLAPGDRFWDIAALVSIEKEQDGVLHGVLSKQSSTCKKHERHGLGHADVVYGNYGGHFEFIGYGT